MKKNVCFEGITRDGMNDRQIDWQLTAMASAMHFLVDGVCLCTLYLLSSSTSIKNLMAVFALYNVLAFMTQPLTGWGADRLRHRHWMLLASTLLLILAAVVAYGVMSDECEVMSEECGVWIATSFLGIGNSLFHVWGGKETAVRTGNDIRALGFFVATGAMGLTIGLLFFSWTLLVSMLVALCMLVGAVVFRGRIRSAEGRLLPKGRKNEVRGVRSEEQGVRKDFQSRSSIKGGFLVFLIMLFVMLRSFVGELISSGIHRTVTIALVIGATAMLGKMAGGWLAKVLDTFRAFVALLLMTACCYFAQPLHEGFAFAGLFMVNCTMPITLYWANCLLPNREGLAFGLLAAALMPGYLLAIM